MKTTYSATGTITASCGRRQPITVEFDARNRETAKRRFARYKRLWIGDTRWNARLDLRTIRTVKTPSECLALLSQQLAEARTVVRA